jgi:RNA polymerase sigma-70 factor (ECF subfamily)
MRILFFRRIGFEGRAGCVMIAVEEQLTHAVLAGDEDALSELLRRHGQELRQRLTGQIGRQYRSAVDEDDVLQVTYMEAFLRIYQFTNAGSGSFLAWLTRIAENNLRDAIRELDAGSRPPRARQLHAAPMSESYDDLLSSLVGSDSTPFKRAARGESKEIIEAALEELPLDYAKVIRLYDLELLEIEKVAAALNRSKGATHMLRARAHDRLRELLGEEGRFFSDKA